ncbi:MAG TPA: pitrilysin family protein, partial [Phycisphaerae bacterium]|nr:pitrilysin family protein [Phycisphaerae bacterium]
ETLDNGLKMLLVERHEEPTVAAGVFYKVGSVNDPAGKSGIAHLFEHMLFKGSNVIGTSDYEAERTFIEQQDALRATMNAEMNRMRLMKRRGEITDVLDPEQWTDEYRKLKAQYDELIEAQRRYIKNNELANLYSANGGARLNAGTGEDMTMYYVQLPSNKLELFFWLESDRMANGIMREFYVERDNVREERRLRTESTPTGKFREAFEALFWQSHPYGVPVLGWASEVESITRDDVRGFYKTYYAPNNATLVMVGDFDSQQAMKLARQYFGRIPACPNPPEPMVTEEPPPIAERRFYAEAETNPQVQVRYHAVAIGHKDEAALDVLGELLSGKTGRLYKRLVTEEDAAIGQPRAGNGASKYAGYFELSAVVKEDHTPEQVEQIILEEVDKLREGEITDYELQKVKNQVLASSVRRLQRSIGLMFQLGIYETWYKWEYINESPERMLQVTADDVRRVVKKYFDPKTRTVAIYRTKEGAPTDMDPELAALLADVPQDQHEQVKMMIDQIKQATDPDRLRQRVERMEQMAGSDQAPEEQKAMFEYMVKVLKARLAELEAANEETE